VIYECHVKGLTIQHPDVPEPLRGTYLGLATDPIIDHLLSLGVTAVELLPVHHFVTDRRLYELGLSNYWGYESIGFLAPDVRYATGALGQQVSEFKSMVKRLHRAGIEVILDVVYNHTAEGNHLGPTLCFRGLDNSAYYRLEAEHPRFYTDYTGCGNTLDVRHSRALQLVMDSLRYWVRSGSGARPRERRGVAFRRVLRRGAAGPGSLPSQAHRRALGSRARRLSGRELPDRLG
jgi:isoamylase